MRKNLQLGLFYITTALISSILLHCIINNCSVAANVLSYAPVVDSSLICFPSEHDIVINEIMADPTPVVGLPDVEYVELYNRSQMSLSMKGCTIMINKTKKPLPDFVMSPNSYVVMCKPKDTTSLSPFAKVLGVAGFPALTNGGTVIELINREGETVDNVLFSDDWHDSSDKKKGGWSLERIDFNRFCSQNKNWASSIDNSGGSPGYVNSMYYNNIDDDKPYISGYKIVSNRVIELHFSEDVFSFSKISLSGNMAVDSVVIADSLMSVYLANCLANNNLYSIVVECVIDGCGNVASRLSVELSIDLPQKGDLYISEILFNPRDDGSDFVELYNAGNNPVNLYSLWLATRDNSFSIKSLCRISNEKKLLPSKSYLLITTDMDNVSNNYIVPKDVFFVEISKIPAFANEKGTVVVVNDSMAVIDEMAYSEAMHDVFIADVDGVSLERISFDQVSGLETNWHSAASSVGYATPGYANSQAETASVPVNQISFLSDVVSPNGDGYNDALEVTVETDIAGYKANISIFDSRGSRVSNPVIGETLGRVWQYDFTADKLPQRSGTYILFVEMLHSNGYKKILKKAFHITM